MARVLLARVRSSEDNVCSPLSTVQGRNGLNLKMFKASVVLRASLGSGKARLGHWGVDMMVEPPSSWKEGKARGSYYSLCTKLSQLSVICTSTPSEH